MSYDLPALPDGAGENEPYVAFTYTQCRACGAQEPVERNDDAKATVWASDHTTATGHDRFHWWTLSRSSLRIETIGALTRRAKGKTT